VDIAYLFGGGLFWLAMVLMVVGLKKLEKPKGDKP
jgi:hypothetical protein